MGKRLIIGGVIFLALWGVVLGVFLWLRFGGEQPVRVGSSVVIPTPSVSPGAPVPTGSRSWAEQMLVKYPYKKGQYSGVLPAKSVSEVWVFGKRIEPPTAFDPKKYVAIENSYGKFYAKLWERTDYKIQKGEDLGAPAISTSAAETAGGIVAARMTYVDNFGLVLEVRRLIPIPQ